MGCPPSCLETGNVLLSIDVGMGSEGGVMGGKRVYCLILDNCQVWTHHHLSSTVMFHLKMNLDLNMIFLYN